ncbi:Sulfopropanediol 3-dehydrogenase [Leclercia adecarboxylata]|uniref:Sulfopropanediol 3-dehydrogenase n=1 Tax=Leclercia adecarboxylata TaxID=83655 RepID=A0A4U9HS24_9ENTR|nr:Sulfopropanediol 3-dehydrogenase [Leclercia adecarboxylata]
MVCDSEEQLIAFADYMATEHLQVHTRDPHGTASKIRNYGSLFIGQNASVVFSDQMLRHQPYPADHGGGALYRWVVGGGLR